MNNFFLDQTSLVFYPLHAHLPSFWSSHWIRSHPPSKSKQNSEISCSVLNHVLLFLLGKITLRDLKRCKLSHIFFDTFFNIEKYLDHEQRDPLMAARVMNNRLFIEFYCCYGHLDAVIILVFFVCNFIGCWDNGTGDFWLGEICCRGVW